MGNFVQDEKGLRVGFIHHMPFDLRNGMGKTEQELLQIGALVDDIPEPEQIEGKNAVLYYNPETNSVYYEYIDRPLTDQERIEELEKAILEISMLLVGAS